ncbi:hypothetical protein PROFUN_13364 [Planoprotostelium fungivorum]|uniref:Uncharacterized protein n=1 Tax=Planoprotostelium fungivorum TaxID=1890364 RepID=A0A2P6N433_9EUKA|nr:hypothetical protein PROFUN_13364 [Planoprotostelium fungivorum]
MQRLLLLCALTWLSVSSYTLTSYVYRGSTCSGNPKYANIIKPDCVLQSNGRYLKTEVNTNTMVAVTKTFSNAKCTLDAQLSSMKPLGVCNSTPSGSMMYQLQEFVQPESSSRGPHSSREKSHSTITSNDILPMQAVKRFLALDRSKTTSSASHLSVGFLFGALLVALFI